MRPPPQQVTQTVKQAAHDLVELIKDDDARVLVERLQADEVGCVVDCGQWSWQWEDDAQEVKRVATRVCVSELEAQAKHQRVQQKWMEQRSHTYRGCASVETGEAALSKRLRQNRRKSRVAERIQCFTSVNNFIATSHRCAD